MAIVPRTLLVTCVIHTATGAGGLPSLALVIEFFEKIRRLVNKRN